MALATIEAIRDRIATLLEGLTPTTLPRDKLRRFRHEEGADFEEQMERNPSAALRRFWVREVGTDEIPETSSGIEERVRARIEVRIAYPQTHRYGAANALDRDDVMNQDWRAINAIVGIYGGATGAASFSGAHDCIPLGATKTREQGAKIDYMLVTIDVEYLRSIAA